jgi:hypothetical protein
MSQVTWVISCLVSIGSNSSKKKVDALDAERRTSELEDRQQRQLSELEAVIRGCARRNVETVRTIQSARWSRSRILGNPDELRLPSGDVPKVVARSDCVK